MHFPLYYNVLMKQNFCIDGNSDLEPLLLTWINFNNSMDK